MVKHNKKAVREKLRKHIKITYGSQAEAAKAWGYMHRNSVHRMLSNVDLIPDKILKKIGIKRVKPESYYIEVRK